MGKVKYSVKILHDHRCRRAMMRLKKPTVENIYRLIQDVRKRANSRKQEANHLLNFDLIIFT